MFRGGVASTPIKLPGRVLTIDARGEQTQYGKSRATCPGTEVYLHGSRVTEATGRMSMCSPLQSFRPLVAQVPAGLSTAGSPTV